LTEMLVRNGNTVFAVEPNDAMRAAAENLLREFPNFRSVNGTAEATTLKDASVEFVTAAQAFHWFDVEGARREFSRILKPGGWVALVWNMRKTDTTPFLREVENILLTYGTDYERVAAHYAHEATLRQFFAHGFEVKRFKNYQVFDYAGLRGRILSASYAPQEGHENYELMLAALRRAFDAYNTGGTVTFEYDTEIYYGQPG
jgi:ubiquinone/menaquinone biosynthesis C-methylase UbiE